MFIVSYISICYARLSYSSCTLRYINIIVKVTRSQSMTLTPLDSMSVSRGERGGKYEYVREELKHTLTPPHFLFLDSTFGRP